jgi:hypothetical protein
VNRQVESFQRFIFSTIDNLVQSLEGLTEAQLNWRPAASDTNSLYAIAAHVLGNAEENVLQTVCGCYCLTPTGARVDGYVIAYRFTEVPSVVK